ncbi:MAG: ATP-binding protein [Limisphaerales bacterium]
MEAALRSQTGILESILNSMGDGVIVADTQARILLYNPAAERLLRSSLSNVTFQDWLLQQQIFLPDRLTPYPVQEHPLMKAIRGESTDSAEMFLRDPRTKEEIWLSATGRPLMQNKREKGGVLVFSDVSSSKLLEKQIAEVSDRERLRMGQDLHDGVCQQLVSTAFAASVLRQKLEEKGIQEAKSAEQIVDLLNDAITDARRLARGLYPVKLEVDGLTIALEELAENVEHMSEINCRFECDQPVSISDPVVATNLFRIAQEAVNNAIKHSQAKNIIIELEAVEEEVTLSVRDDGVGFSGKKAENGSGMGLHIMNYRARLIGASLDVRPSATGGTTVICSFLNLNQVKDTHEHTRAA